MGIATLLKVAERALNAKKNVPEHYAELVPNTRVKKVEPEQKINNFRCVTLFFESHHAYQL